MGERMARVNPATEAPDNPAEPFLMPDGKPKGNLHPDLSCSGYPQDYLDAKARVGEHFVTLSDGRKICYFKDGNPMDMPMICLHGGGESKWSWLQKQPIPGLYMIAMDRMGYGGSDLCEGPTSEFTCGDAVDDVKQVADLLGFKESILCGFSMGTCWSLQTGTQLGDRVKGIILFGTMGDTGHPKVIESGLVSKIGKPPGILNPFTGCCSCILKGVFEGMAPKMQKYDFSDMLGDDSTNPGTRAGAWPDFCKDNFWVCTKVDSCRGNKNPQALMGDAYRSLFNPWTFDISTVKCPVYVFQGEFDTDMGSANPAAPESIKLLIPHTVYEVLPGMGHMTCTGPNDSTRNAITKAASKMGANVSPSN